MPNDKIEKFISSNEQEAVVIAVVPTPSPNEELVGPYVKVICSSPVWGDVVFKESAKNGTQRGDIVKLQRFEMYLGESGNYDYEIIDNRTWAEIQRRAFAKIMGKFTRKERRKIIELALERRKNTK